MQNHPPFHFFELRGIFRGKIRRDGENCHHDHHPPLLERQNIPDSCYPKKGLLMTALLKTWWQGACWAGSNEDWKSEVSLLCPVDCTHDCHMKGKCLYDMGSVPCTTPESYKLRVRVHWLACALGSCKQNLLNTTIPYHNHNGVG